MATLLAAALTVCAAVAVFDVAVVGGPAAREARGLPAGVSPLAVQPRVSASDDPLLMRVPGTKGPRWASIAGFGLFLVLAAAHRIAKREPGRSFQRACAASSLSRAPPVPVMTLS